MENQGTIQNPTERRRKILVWTSIIYSLVISNFIFWSGFYLGFFLAVIIQQIALFLLFPKPVSKKAFNFSIFLSASILLLGFTYFRYSDIVLGVINFLVITLLIVIQLLIYSQSTDDDWDSVGFFISIVLSYIIRPFIALDKMPKEFKNISSSNKTGEQSQTKKVLMQILIGVLISIPLLAIAIALLRTSDMVFQNYTDSFVDIFANINFQEIIVTIILGAFVFPFLFSFLYSHQNKVGDILNKKCTDPNVSGNFSLNPVMVSTVLVLLNLVYGFFALIQFGALFGAFKSVLPDNISYAEYARQGFFQLLFVSLLNISLAVICVLFVSKNGFGRMFSKIMSITLIAFTFVLLSSAAYRMKMYIDIYYLSKLRVFTSLFMVLIAIVLVLTLIKEFYPNFKFFKSTFICALLVLLITNYININFLIARFNTDQYLANPSIEENSEYASNHIDSNYLIYNLSYDAILPTMDLLDSENKNLTDSLREKLKEIYENKLEDYRDGNFKRWNISKERAKILIEEKIISEN